MQDSTPCQKARVFAGAAFVVVMIVVVAVLMLGCKEERPPIYTWDGAPSNADCHWSACVVAGYCHAETRTGTCIAERRAYSCVRSVRWQDADGRGNYKITCASLVPQAPESPK